MSKLNLKSNYEIEAKAIKYDGTNLDEVLDFAGRDKVSLQKDRSIPDGWLMEVGPIFLKDHAHKKIELTKGCYLVQIRCRPLKLHIYKTFEDIESLKENFDIEGEQFTCWGCCAISEDEFEKEIDNFVLEDGTKLGLLKGDTWLSIIYCRGDESCGKLPTLTLENFCILSKKTVRLLDNSLLELDCDSKELKAIQAKGFKSSVNIDAPYWHGRFKSKLMDMAAEDKKTNENTRSEIDFESVRFKLSFGDGHDC